MIQSFSVVQVRVKNSKGEQRLFVTLEEGMSIAASQILDLTPELWLASRFKSPRAICNTVTNAILHEGSSEFRNDLFARHHCNEQVQFIQVVAVSIETDDLEVSVVEETPGPLICMEKLPAKDQFKIIIADFA